MRIIKILVLSFIKITFLATMAIAEGKMPNYGCDKKDSDCISVCDKAADTSKNAKKYDNCLASCKKQAESCNKRQEAAAECAEKFQEVIKNSKTEKEREAHRAAYKKCKGDQ